MAVRVGAKNSVHGGSEESDPRGTEDGCGRRGADNSSRVAAMKGKAREGGSWGVGGGCFFSPPQAPFYLAPLLPLAGSKPGWMLSVLSCRFCGLKTSHRSSLNLFLPLYNDEIFQARPSVPRGSEEGGHP